MRISYPFVANLDKCYVSCNTFDVPYSRICVANKTEDAILNVFNMIKQKQLNFCFTGPTNLNFLANENNSYIDFTYKHSFAVYIFSNIIFLNCNRIHKTQKFSALHVVIWRSKDMWSVSYVTCVDIIAQVSLTWWSMFLFLEVPTLKLRIIIIVLSTDQPELILWTLPTTKSQAAFTW